jgi:hypothetical protein
VSQVFIGEFLLYKPHHSNITNALTTWLHFVVDALAAFIVSILVQIVRAPLLVAIPLNLAPSNIW